MCIVKLDLDSGSVDPSDPGKWLSYLREGNLFIQQDKLDPSRTNVYGKTYMLQNISANAFKAFHLHRVKNLSRCQLNGTSLQFT